jgi:hypothetical protein
MNDPFQLPQTLILPPDTAFASVAACLKELGFSQAETGTVTRPVLPGEPELANWRHQGGLPIVQYSFNPVVRLRLLEVATLPPELRGRIAARLHPLPASAVPAALASDDDRQRLFGVWAAVETERTDLLHDLTRVHETARGVLREEAEAALHRLGDLTDARLEILSSAQLIREAAMDVFGGLGSGDRLAELVPDAGECAAMFHPSIAAGVLEAVRARGRPGRGMTARPASTADIAVAPAGALRWQNELSEAFPRGYRRIAGWMEPSRIWLAWTGREPDGGAVRMDGLAFVNGRWVYLPKPWRIVEPLMPECPGSSAIRPN